MEVQSFNLNVGKFSRIKVRDKSCKFSFFWVLQPCGWFHPRQCVHPHQLKCLKSLETFSPLSNIPSPACVKRMSLHVGGIPVEKKKNHHKKTIGLLENWPRVLLRSHNRTNSQEIADIALPDRSNASNVSLPCDSLCTEWFLLSFPLL